jgi:hypothetical protein
MLLTNLGSEKIKELQVVISIIEAGIVSVDSALGEAEVEDDGGKTGIWFNLKAVREHLTAADSQLRRSLNLDRRNLVGTDQDAKGRLERRFLVTNTQILPTLS